MDEILKKMQVEIQQMLNGKIHTKTQNQIKAVIDTVFSKYKEQLQTIKA